MLKLRLVLLALSVLLTAEAFQPHNKERISTLGAASSNIIIDEEKSTPEPKIMEPLTTSSVEEAIDRATRSDLQQQLQDRYGLSLRTAKDDDWKMADDASVSQLKTPGFFGMTICKDGKEIGLISFYVAYSSWSGRILYLDQLLLTTSDEEVVTMDNDMEQHILRILASIAVDLQFARLTWRHKDTPNWHSEGSNHPEIHGEVLTLSMDQETMKTYVGESEAQTANDVVESFSSATKVIDDCLAAVNTANSESNFRLRLAKAGDLETIGRLVQGLADYVKEPDSVELGVDDYRLDGFSDGSDPLFRCILLDHVNKDTGDVHTCGFAFCFFGYVLGSGRFLYLEDLFLEVDFRQNGGGNLLMKTLARICLAMQCQHLYWQALDWNTAGLKFYSKIGAKILEGEKTSRYCGDVMKLFAEQGTA
jgi:hypothetical protein